MFTFTADGLPEGITKLNRVIRSNTIAGNIGTRKLYQ
jgi:hypothetical protein